MAPRAQIPPELVGTIARYVADGNSAFRSTTLTCCMSVSKTFAKEFRRFLFEALLINDLLYEGLPQPALKRISRCRDLLRQHPEYAPMVKKVAIAMSRTLVSTQGTMILQTLGDLLGRLSSVCSVFVGSATPGQLFSPQFEGVDDFDKAISRICNLPTITTLSFDGCLEISLTALNRAPHFQQVTLQDVMFCRPSNGSNFDPSYLADGFHLILRGRVDIPDDATSFLSRVKKLSGLMGRLHGDGFRKAVRSSCLSGYLRTLDITIRDVELGAEILFLNLSGGTSLQHIYFTFTSTTLLESQEGIAQILISIVSTLPSASAVQSVNITFSSVVSAEALVAGDTVRTKWKEFDCVLSDPKRFPVLERVRLHVTYETSKTANEKLLLKATASSMLTSLSDNVLTVSVYPSGKV